MEKKSIKFKLKKNLFMKLIVFTATWTVFSNKSFCQITNCYCCKYIILNLLNCKLIQTFKFQLKDHNNLQIIMFSNELSFYTWFINWNDKIKLVCVTRKANKTKHEIIIWRSNTFTQKKWIKCGRKDR